METYGAGNLARRFGNEPQDGIGGVVKVGPEQWERYGLKSWIEAAKKRLHHNVLAIALANKLARIAWAVPHKGRAFECVKTNALRPA